TSYNCSHFCGFHFSFQYAFAYKCSVQQPAVSALKPRAGVSFPLIIIIMEACDSVHNCVFFFHSSCCDLALCSRVQATDMFSDMPFTTVEVCALVSLAVPCAVSQFMCLCVT